MPRFAISDMSDSQPHDQQTRFVEFLERTGEILKRPMAATKSIFEFPCGRCYSNSHHSAHGVYDLVSASRLLRLSGSSRFA